MLSATIYAKNFPAMVDLYRGLLNAEVIDEGDSFCTMAGPEFSLTVAKIPSEIADTFEISLPPLPREDAAIKLSIPVEDLSAARRLIRTHGGVDDEERSPWVWNDVAHLNVTDLEGNVLELTSSP
jgi:hypothetical protein